MPTPEANPVQSLAQAYVDLTAALDAFKDPAGGNKAITDVLRSIQSPIAQTIRQTRGKGLTQKPTANTKIRQLALVLGNPPDAFGQAGKAKVYGKHKQLKAQLLASLYGSLRTLHQTGPGTLWPQIRDGMNNLYKVAKYMATSTTESKVGKKQSRLEARLRGRLAMLECTGQTNQSLSYATLSEAYGERVAKMVASGNQGVISLITLAENKAAYTMAPVVDLALLSEYEDQIAAARTKLGYDEGVGRDLTAMLRLAVGTGYESKEQFKQQLQEGLILNINTLSAKALSIPNGEYLVWATDPGHTMLVPAEAKDKGGDVVASEGTTYDIHTPSLLHIWNKIERIIDEEGEKVRDFKTDRSGPEGGAREPHVTKSQEGQPSLRRMREQAGLSLKDLSDRSGLAVPTIAKHELGYANPSYDSMERIIDALNAEPDVFFKPGPVEPYQHMTDKGARNDPANVGVSHAGAGIHTGTTRESIDAARRAILEAIQHNTQEEVVQAFQQLPPPEQEEILEIARQLMQSGAELSPMPSRKAAGQRSGFGPKPDNTGARELRAVSLAMQQYAEQKRNQTQPQGHEWGSSSPTAVR